MGGGGNAGRDPWLPGQARVRPADARLVLATSEPRGALPHAGRHDRGPGLRGGRRGAEDEAAEHCRTLLECWQDSEDHHFCIWGLHWAAAFLARRGDRAGVHDCAQALTRIASDTGHGYALAALAHSIGETALLEGDIETAADQLARAVEIYRGLDVPFERAQVELRAGVALAAAGEREPALERLNDAYRTARKLGARPLAAEAAGEVGALGARDPPARRAPRPRPTGPGSPGASWRWCG